MKYFILIVTLLGVALAGIATGYKLRDISRTPINVVRHDVCGNTEDFVVTFSDGTSKPFSFPLTQDQYAELKGDIAKAKHLYTAGLGSPESCSSSTIDKYSP